MPTQRNGIAYSGLLCWSTVGGGSSNDAWPVREKGSATALFPGFFNKKKHKAIRFQRKQGTNFLKKLGVIPLEHPKPFKGRGEGFTKKTEGNLENIGKVEAWKLHPAGDIL